MDKLSTAILDAISQPPAAEAVAVMQLSCVDWLSVGIAGRDEPVAQMVRDMVLAEQGAGQAALFGGGRAPARGAALVNGTVSHALDYDDTHFAHIGHPSVAILSAALAVGEQVGATTGAVITAALQGCEASVRFGLAFGRSHYQTGFHQTATAGAFGATVAAGALLGLTRAQMGHALGLVSTRASGLKSQFGTMGKPFNAGIAASNGVEAATLAARGFISNPDAVSGALGFVPTHHCDGDAAQPQGWLMTDVSHKFHACCHGLHATLEALETLKPVDPQSVTALEITTHPRWMTVCNKPAPTTGLEAKFSYRAVVALSLLGHETGALATYDDALCQAPEVVALRDKVAVTADETVTETAARVVLHTAEGRREATFDLAQPMTLEARSDRVARKSAALVGAEQAARLWAAVHDSDDPLTAMIAELA